MLGPQDLYRVAKETGQLVSNVQTAGTDAWKVRVFIFYLFIYLFIYLYIYTHFLLQVFQEAMEAEGTMAAMGASVNEINNVSEYFPILFISFYFIYFIYLFIYSISISLAMR